ncbi:hypothetical protein EW026_g1131 [Hermanssonia centrifuga]|uniref:Myb-like domain-containing protein n=1 Tax=Hermanssonia centrifuga TaxID=98765 RepID=A0A4S4KSM6_9APHY|nr:hypothetical protein EW026_g1131 [Hermanssonia centrifuga]
MSSYGTMPPPPPPGAAPPSTTPGATGPVISNPQSFVMPLGAPPPPGYPPQSYYSTPYTAAPGGRYPTAPYYPYAAQPPAQYYPAPTPAPTTPAAPVASTSSAPPVPGASLSAFSATTGNAAPGGTQGAWSEEETDRLRRLADQSRDMGGAQSKGEIEWDWVVQQWGNTRTRHQILLKATSLGLKESTTRGTKRRRGDDGGATESNANTSASVPTSNVTTVTPVTTFVSAPPTATSAIAPSPGQSSATSNPPSANASPATQPQRPPSTTVIAPARTTSGTTSGMPWPMPTVAANTPSPVMAHTQVDNRTAAYYRPRPGQQQQQQQQAQYGAGPVANTVPSPSRAVAARSDSKPRSSLSSPRIASKMSISPEIATNGNTAGPGLPAANGLPAGSAVNQSPTTAQNHHAQDAYPVSTNYASYFSAPQHSNVNTLTPAYFPPESQRQEVVRHEQTPYERIQPPIQSHGEHEYAEDSQDPDNDELQYDDSPVDPSPAPSLLLASSKRKKKRQ